MSNTLRALAVALALFGSAIGWGPQAAAHTQMASETAFSAHPASGGYPGKIVYDTTSLGHSIFLINPTGKAQKKVAVGFSPLFSPDGKQVAFLNVLNHNPPFGTIAISTVSLDGSGKQNLCPTDANAEFNLIRWSPRSRFIALNAGQFLPGYIYLCNTATKTLNTTNLTTQQGPVYLVYDWTPDGAHVLWQTGPTSPSPDFNLYYGDPTQGGRRAIKLTSGQFRSSFYYTFARFSPDGKTIAIAGSKLFFLSAPGQNSPLAGKVIAGLTHPYSLAWSPDGRALVVTDCHSPRPDCLGQERKTLKLVDIASGRITKLAENVGAADWSRT